MSRLCMSCGTKSWQPQSPIEARRISTNLRVITRLIEPPHLLGVNRLTESPLVCSGPKFLSSQADRECGEHNMRTFLLPVARCSCPSENKGVEIRYILSG